MKRRDYIISTLVQSGFRVSMKGFNQFCSCIELYLDDNTATIESIYCKVATAFSCSTSSVEKNLRRLFCSSDACKAISRMYNIKYNDSGNKQILVMFANYIELNRAHYAEIG